LNKLGHVIISIMLISSTAAIHLMDGEDPDKEIEIEEPALPSFEGIELDRENKRMNLSSMSVRQKASLMIISYSYSREIPDDRIVGGIHLDSAASKEEFEERIEKYKEGREIKPVISADLEGCIEPTGKFRDFKSFKKVKNSSEAFQIGKTQGQFLADIGADINFAPVVDLEDSIWGCRSFPGDYRTVAEKACAYIEGLHSEGILTTSKHFPGRTLTGKDPHNKLKHVTVGERDLFPFKASIRCGTDAVMPSHQVSNGSFVTGGVPADVSPRTRKQIREEYNFTGLIVSDAISMEGLRGHYESREERYVDLFRNNDVVLNLVGGLNDTVQMIDIVEEGVRKGSLEERYLTDSVRRIMTAKGWKVRMEIENRQELYRPD
jgi:beta-glucosidase-like glycosyl hydrolase